MISTDPHPPYPVFKWTKHTLTVTMSFIWAKSSRLSPSPGKTYILELSRLARTEDATGNLLESPNILLITINIKFKNG